MEHDVPTELLPSAAPQIDPGGASIGDDAYRRFVSRIGDFAIYTLSPSGVVTSWNTGAEWLTGYRSVETVGRHHSFLYTGQSVAAGKPDQDLTAAERDGRFSDLGWRVASGGREFWCQSSVIAVRSDDGTLEGFVAVAYAFGTVQGADSEVGEQYRLLIASVKDYAIFMLDPDGRIVTWNEGAQRLKGYTADEIVGQHFSKFYPPPAISSRWPWTELERAAADGRLEDEGWRVRKDGSQFWANVVITAVRDRRGRLLGFTKVTRDLTERKAAEEAIRQSEERYRLLVSGVKDYAIFMLDPNGNVLTWNEGAQRIKGYTAEDIIGQHFSKFYPEEAIAARWPWTELERAAADGRIEDEGWRLRKDGSRFWANVIITALRDESGKLYGFSKVTRDMTERRRSDDAIRSLNYELEARVEELAESNREVALKSAENEAFVYSVSHDVRSPLVNLQGFSHEMKYAADELRALLGDERVPQGIRERAFEILETGVLDSVRHVQAAVGHLSNMIDGLLRLSRAGRVVYQSSEVSLQPLVERIVASLGATVADRGAEIKIEELPVVWGDAAALEQLFSNLISNALKYLEPRRKGLIRVGAAPSSDGGESVVFIEDNGAGLSAAAQAKLFHVFQRFHPHLASGEGMGLAIAHRIVERHNGRIWVESTAGKGSTFFVALPTAPPDPPQD